MAAKKPSLDDFEPPPQWEIYKQLPGLVLGFHGCDKQTAENVFSGHVRQLEQSDNKHDWLGRGIYFWEADPWRALDFAREAKENGYLTKGKIETPWVVGAVIDLGVCCNLLEFDAVGELARAYDVLHAAFELAGVEMPKNTGADLGKRERDRAVIEAMHGFRREANFPSYQTVRAAFVEGEPLYEGAGFRRKNHIQIAIRDVGCIKGYFRLPGM